MSPRRADSWSSNAASGVAIDCIHAAIGRSLARSPLKSLVEQKPRADQASAGTIFHRAQPQYGGGIRVRRNLPRCSISDFLFPRGVAERVQPSARGIDRLPMEGGLLARPRHSMVMSRSLATGP